MKIVIAPDSFKGSLDARDVADCIENGIRRVYDNIEIVKVPMADGGEGTVHCLCTKIEKVTVNDPLMRKIESFYGIMDDGRTAVIEMAAASGLPLLSAEERNPCKTTTYGTGELVQHALDKGCRRFIIGIGGSSTNDAGTGMLKALGVKFIDEQGKELEAGGASLTNLNTIDISNIDYRVKECEFIVACDVDNPLCGERGASAIFGPQKGATEEMVYILDKALNQFAYVVRRDFQIEIENTAGSGAAGGLGAGMLAFMDAKLRKGIDIVIENTKLEEKMKGANLVFTGEGMIDYQTQYGKTPYGVAQIAGKHNIPVIGIAGGLGKNAEAMYKKGFASLFSIVNKPMELQTAIDNARELIEDTAERVARVIALKDIT